MPDFTFTSPDGKQYTVSGPDGATHDQAFAMLQSKLKDGTIAPDKAATPTPPESQGFGTQMLNAGKDVAGSLARAGADVVGAFKQDSPEELRAREASYSQPFQHPEQPEQPGSEADVKQAALAKLPSVTDIPAVKNAMESPAGQFAGKSSRPAANLVGAAGSLEGAGALARAGAGAMDTGINAAAGALRPAAQAERIGANQQLVRARADGFKLTGNDVRAATNPADTARPNADLPGPTSTSPDTQDAINVHNQALATQRMAADVNLPNTRNINPDEVAARMEKEGQTYKAVGDAIGTGRQPSALLDHDLATAGAKDADPKVQAKIDQDVQYYRDHFAKGFDGPEAVQTVRTLRNSASELADSQEPGRQARGRTYQNMADAIEDEMMRQLPAQAQDLRAAFPAARQQLAKLHELADVTEGGQVNPAKVLALKQAGKPLSGAADSVANAADVAPESMQAPGGSPSTVTSVPHGMGLWRDVWNTMKAGVHKLPGMNPSTEAYQAARYGPTGGSAATPPSSAAPSVSPVRAPAALQPPPGEVGRAPPVQSEMSLPPADWDRAALAAARKYKGERPGAEGPPVLFRPGPGRTVAKRLGDRMIGENE